MTADNPMPRTGRKPFVVWVIVVAVIVVGASVLGSILAGIEGLVAVATIATALGTLALAWQTFALATSSSCSDGKSMSADFIPARRRLLKRSWAAPRRAPQRSSQ